jgi:oligosaccharide repeat unit polymerase
MRIPYCIIVGISFAGLIAIILPGDTPQSMTSLILLANIALMTGGLLSNVTSREERCAEYYYYLYFILFFLLPGYVHLSTNKFPFYDMSYPKEDMCLASICVLLFSVSVLFGYSLARKYQKKQRRRMPPKQNPQYGLATVYAIVSFAVAIGFGFEYYTASRLGELPIQYTPLTQIAMTAPRILSFVAFLVSLVGLSDRFSLGRFAFSLFTVSIFLSLNSPLAIARFALFAYVIIILVVFFKHTMVRKAALGLAFFIGQLTIFPAISLFSRGDIEDLLSTSLFDYYASNGDFDGFQSTINVVRYAEYSGYHHGLNLLSALLFFVPRDFWPGKSIGTGGDAATFNGYDFINVSSPLPSEFYIDFGMIGTIIGAAFFGALLAKMDAQIRLHRETDNKLGLFCPATVVGFLFIILRGSLIGIMGPFVLTYSIVWLSAKSTSLQQRAARFRRVFAPRKLFDRVGAH